LEVAGRGECLASVARLPREGSSDDAYRVRIESTLRLRALRRSDCRQAESRLAPGRKCGRGPSPLPDESFPGEAGG
jgi:hypothetical protein